MTFTLLGGRLILDGPPPPEDGLWLAASLSRLAPGARVLDAAAGSGVAGLALLVRQPHLVVRGVELQPALAAQANANAALNGFRSYACEAGDVKAVTGRFDALLCNPPFHAAARGHRSPRPGKQLAHHLPDGLLGDWLAHFTTMTQGSIHLLLHSALTDELQALAAGLGLHAVVTPLASHVSRPPKRLLAVLTPGQGWEVRPAYATHDKQNRQRVLAAGEAWAG